MDNMFVITYKENDTAYSVIWEGYLDSKDALKAFWLSYDYDDMEKVTDVKIYSLTEIETKTDSSIVYDF